MFWIAPPSCTLAELPLESAIHNIWMKYPRKVPVLGCSKWGHPFEWYSHDNNGWGLLLFLLCAKIKLPHKICVLNVNFLIREANWWTRRITLKSDWDQWRLVLEVYFHWMNAVCEGFNFRESANWFHLQVKLIRTFFSFLKLRWEYQSQEDPTKQTKPS